MNRALLVGINSYPGSPLNGCVNDVSDMAKFLVGKCGFAKADIHLLTDARATTDRIRRRLGWLLNGLRPGDRVVFHFSGHGVQVATRNPQLELDGKDEAVCPFDFDWTEECMIRDKEFNAMFSTIPAGVIFTWISDSCHSGDLTKEFAMPGGIKSSRNKTMLPPADIDWRLQTADEMNIKALTFEKAASQLNLALISGCKSGQTSADAFIEGRYNGALTYFLLKELNSPTGMKASLTSVVRNINAALSRADYTQDPRLEGNQSLKSKAFLSAAKSVKGVKVSGIKVKTGAKTVK